MPNIVNVAYGSCNYYVIEGDRASLLVDVGWPETLPRLQHECRRMDIDLGRVSHLLVTHYHPDHGGLARELQLYGITLVVLENQSPGLDWLNQFLRSKGYRHDILADEGLALQTAQSRSFLRGLGLAGEVLVTAGHSDDSVTLILDSGEAFTGDLPAPQIAAYRGPAALESWARVQGRVPKMAWPFFSSHAPRPRRRAS